MVLEINGYHIIGCDFIAQSVIPMYYDVDIIPMIQKPESSIYKDKSFLF